MEVCVMKVEMNNNSNMGYVSNERVETKKVDMPKVFPEERVDKEVKGKETSERDAQKIKETVEKLNKELKNVDKSIEFKIHESHEGGLNRVSIKVVERESEKVIMEIPSEEAIEFSEKMDEITGILFDHKG